ncbi:4'-phosphopantetheinyl transferase family protein [Microvirga thermotolerans]|uniref:4'-phosphopantetheinyl transferase superfamily protein n=1 Tax=Microvirga thermotolerans TaxID=2651334 RepID=A0A5P9K4U2_9HYPH|nr:4'-phosphopantetheinyl transferase superfamily protein [Microvirga thermotolerans]QFU17484.1 4'-phosphopantetheinyl transferase superfamily protein [Microvirga thermotolerans]
MILLSTLALATLSERGRTTCLAAFEAAAGASERGQAERLRREQDQVSYRVSHGFLRLALASEAGCIPEDIDIRFFPGEKPVCPGGPHFNMSHAGNWVVVAVSRSREVGVDVEALPRDREASVPMAVSPEEMPLLPSLADRRDRAETLLWSIKEAALKLTGEVMVEPGHLAVRPAGEGLFRVGPARAATAPVREAFVRQIRLDGEHVLSLATYEAVPLSQIAAIPDCWRGPPGPNIAAPAIPPVGHAPELRS